MESRSEKLNMKVSLSATQAVLTFTDHIMENEDHWLFKSKKRRDLQSLQSTFHPGIPEENFVHSFTDDDINDPYVSGYQCTGFDSAFTSMAHTAFGEHLPVTIRPDDVHHLLAQGVSRFLQTYAEEFRDSVVPFQGKLELRVELDELDDVEEWEQLPAGFAGLIKKMVTPADIAILLLQDYTQTTDMDRVVKASTLMGTFSAYFNYTASTKCHIPKFILPGSVEDWQKVAELPNQLIEHFKLATHVNDKPGSPHKLMLQWLTGLHNVLQNMYLGRSGKVDGAFWNSFYKFESQSGGDEVTGHILHFFPFLKKDRKSSEFVINSFILDDGSTEKRYANGPDTGHLPANFVTVDFMLQHMGVKYEMSMKAGIIAHKENPNNNVLSTHVGYSIFFKKDRPVGFNLRRRAHNQPIVEVLPEERIEETVNPAAVLATSSVSKPMFQKKQTIKVELDALESTEKTCLIM